ncbi:MAG TPA: PDZ domain-containing protein [Bryobacteraceae bacterium]|nr:PDZ domain-containing protein [Bryobacteraceae bacterium]
MMRRVQDFVIACTVVAGVFGAQACAQQWWSDGPGGQFQTLQAYPDLQAMSVAFTPGSYIGVNLAEIDNERAKALKLSDVHGVEITRVEDSSPASKAGLKVGDVVLEYNGQRVEGMEQFGRFVRETPAGREVKLVVSRGGNAQTIPVVVGTRKDMLRSGVYTFPGFDMKDFSVNIPDIHIPDFPRSFSSSQSGMLGVEAESLNSQLAEAFGVKEGVLVRWVAKDSAAEKAGIHAGDVLTKVDGESVSDPTEMARAIRSARAKKSFDVQLVRERREMTVNVTIEHAEATPPPTRTRVVRGEVRM